MKPPKRYKTGCFPKTVVDDPTLYRVGQQSSPLYPAPTNQVSINPMVLVIDRYIHENRGKYTSPLLGGYICFPGVDGIQLTPTTIATHTTNDNLDVIKQPPPDSIAGYLYSEKSIRVVPYPTELAATTIITIESHPNLVKLLAVAGQYLCQYGLYQLDERLCDLHTIHNHQCEQIATQCDHLSSRHSMWGRYTPRAHIPLAGAHRIDDHI